MYKYYILTIICSLALATNAQISLDTIYQDKERKEISKEVFDEMAYSENFIPAYYTEGNKHINYLIFDYDRTTIDKMTPEKVEELRDYLSALTGHRYSPKKTIVIDYYPGVDRSNKYVTTSYITKLFRHYNRAMAQMPHVDQFFIQKKGSDLGKWTGTTKWIEDAEGYIEKNFFPHHYLHASMIVIKPDGSYVKRFGKYELERSFKEISVFSPPPQKKAPVKKLEKM